MNVYNGFINLTADNAVVPLPANNEIDLGGHGICLVGYDLDKQWFIAKNSFGTD